MIITSEVLNKMVEDLGMRFPVATISRDLNISKGPVSEYLKGKKVPSSNFIKQFENFYKVNSLDYLKPKNNSVEKTERLLSNEGLSEEHKQIINDAFLLNKSEVIKIPAVRDFIETLVLKTENDLMREIDGLNKKITQNKP